MATENAAGFFKIGRDNEKITLTDAQQYYIASVLADIIARERGCTATVVPARRKDGEAAKA